MSSPMKLHVVSTSRATGSSAATVSNRRVTAYSGDRYRYIRPAVQCFAIPLTFNSTRQSLSTRSSTVLLLILLLLLSSLLLNSGRIPVVSSSAAGTEISIGIRGKDFVWLATSTGLSNGGVTFTSRYIDKIHTLQPSDAVTTSQSSNGYLPLVLPVIPAIAIAAVGNYADIDQLMGRIRAEYNIYQYESSMTTTTTTTAMYNRYRTMTSHNRGGSVEMVDCRPTTITPTATTTTADTTATTGTGSNNNKHTLDAIIMTTAVLSVSNIAHMVRNYIMTNLRSTSPYSVCTLIAGMKRTKRQSQQRQSIETTTTSITTPAFQLAGHLQQQIRVATSSRDVNKTNSNINRAAIVDQSSTTHNEESNHNNRDNSQDRNDNAERPSPQPQEEYEAVLYWLDEYGSMIDEIPYGVHGYASDMIYSILDQKYHPTMTKEEALELLYECIQQLQTRYMMNTQQHQLSSSSSSLQKTHSFCIKCIDPYGCTIL